MNRDTSTLRFPAIICEQLCLLKSGREALCEMN